MTKYLKSNINKIFLIICIILFIFGIITVLNSLNTDNKVNVNSLTSTFSLYSISNPASSQQIVTDEEKSEMSNIAKYTIKNYMGKIGVFIDGNDVPYLTLDIEVSTLPEFDRLILNRGIEVFSREEMIKVIEDFDG